MNSFRFLQNQSACSWLIGETLIHELGHALGLGHAFENGGNFENMYPATPEPFCHVSDLVEDIDIDIENYHCTNNFMDYTDAQQHISPFQAGRMRNFLANQRSYYQEQPFTPNSPLIISTDTDWTTDKYINQDIRIKTGATLRITDCLSLGDNAAIYVEKGAKLVVKGGQISAKYSPTRDQDMWRAIFAEGNGYVEQSPTTHACIELENATLSYARNAIICSPDNVEQNSGGAFITASNTRFYNNQRDVEFLYYDEKNNSSFTNCSFTKDWRFSRKYGLPIQSVTSNHNWGITFEGCGFSNSVEVSTAMDGVFALGSALYFEDCSFRGFSNAIEGIGSFSGKFYGLRGNFLKP
jgi:hypothetical protein